MIRATLPALVFSLMASPVLAQEWRHAAASMGQKEGGIVLKDGAYGVSYGCADAYRTVTFYATGLFVAAGKGTIRVDGQDILSGNNEYQSLTDKTQMSVHVEKSWGEARQAELDALIGALANGAEAVWVTPDNTEFVIPLTNSAGISACLR